LERQTSSANTPPTLLLARSAGQSGGQGEPVVVPVAAVPAVLVFVVDVLPVDPALDPPLPAGAGEEPVSTRYTPEVSRGADPGTR
jgi:hypothetical protein